MSKESLLNPAYNPGGDPSAGTKHLSRNIGFMIMVLAFLAVFVAGIVGYNRSGLPVGEDAEDQTKVSDGAKMANELVAGHNSGVIPPAVPEGINPSAKHDTKQDTQPAVNGTESSGSRSTPNFYTPPTPPRGQARGDEELLRIHGLQLQHFEQALQSKTSVNVSDVQRSPSGTVPSREEMLGQIATARRQSAYFTNDDATQVYKSKLEQLRQSGAIPSEDSNSPLASSDFSSSPNTDRNALAQFDSTGGDRWLLDKGHITSPRTPFELRAGYVIPATMISGINSDLPGQVIAQVSQHVYNTATGRHIVIPQGTRLIGTYGSDIIYGQERIMMAWQRLVFPDGKSLDLGAMPGADSAGYAGFSDQVNNHFFRTFTSAFLMSGIIAAVSLSQNTSSSSNSDNQRSGDAISEALGQTLGTAMSQMLMKNINVAPTLEIRPGYRFNIMVVKDIPFSGPYKAFDYAGKYNY